MFLYILFFVFRVDKFSFYQSWGSMNVSRYVAIPVNRISIGNEKVKVITVCDPVEIFQQESKYGVQRLTSSNLTTIVLASLYSLQNPQGRIHLYSSSFQRVNSRTYQIVNCNHYVVNPKCILCQQQFVWLNGKTFDTKTKRTGQIRYNFI